MVTHARTGLGISTEEFDVAGDRFALVPTLRVVSLSPRTEGLEVLMQSESERSMPGRQKTTGELHVAFD
jgi:hypothetical protein